MTASKSSRARNARAQANAARNRNAAADRADPSGSAVKTGTAVNTGTAVKTDTAAKTGTGTAAKTGTGTAAKTGTGTAAKTGGSGPGGNGSTSRNAAGSRNGGGSGQAGAVATRGGGSARGSRTLVVQDEAGAAATSGPAVPLWMQLATFLLALAGLGVSIYLTIAHFTQTPLAGCSDSGLVNCTKVTTSPQSYVFGIPVAVLGLAFYLFMAAIMSPWAWRSARREVHLIRVASLVVGMGFVLYLLYAELFIIGNICLYCTSIHAITFVLFVLTVVAAAAWGLGPARQSR